MIRTSTPIAVVTAILIVVAMLFAYRWAPYTFDWQGYQIIYEREGAWLARSNRDVAFVTLVKVANYFLGHDGYPAFRALLGAGFLAFMVWLTFNIPRQRLGQIQAIAVAALIIAIFLLKAAIQIREGLAFGMVVMGLVALLQSRRVVLAFLAMVAAATVHAGVGAFLLLFLLAGLLARFSTRFARDGRQVLVLSPNARFVMGAAGILFGISVVALLTQLGDLSFVLRDLRFYVSSADQSDSRVRFVYWGINAVMCFIICREMIRANLGGNFRPTATAYVEITSRILIPSVLVICLLMVGLDLLPYAISFFARLLFTSMGVGLIIIAITGRLNLMTLLVTLWILADSIRLYAGALRPF